MDKILDSVTIHLEDKENVTKVNTCISKLLGNFKYYCALVFLLLTILTISSLCNTYFIDIHL